MTDTLSPEVEKEIEEEARRVSIELTMRSVVSALRAQRLAGRKEVEAFYEEGYFICKGCNRSGDLDYLAYRMEQKGR